MDIEKLLAPDDAREARIAKAVFKEALKEYFEETRKDRKKRFWTAGKLAIVVMAGIAVGYNIELLLHSQ